MSIKKVYIIAGSILALVTIPLVARHIIRSGRQTDEQRLRWIVDHIAEVSEKKDIKEMRKWLSKSYLDDRGRDYEKINKYLLGYYIRSGSYNAYVLAKDVTVDRGTEPLTASMTVRAVLTRGPKVLKVVDIVPEAAEALTFWLEFRKEDEWRLTSAKWKRLRNYQEFIE